MLQKEYEKKRVFDDSHKKGLSVKLFCLLLISFYYFRAYLLKEATYESTTSQLHQDLTAHTNHMQVLANRLDQIHFEVVSKNNVEIQDLRECLLAEQKEKNEFN
ncbi:uncharacterized protein DS421_9g269500 [Arachis hypogaea]|nr:uncharacterized protein DS421_9g269500 [Arachis hypogaea]